MAFALDVQVVRNGQLIRQLRLDGAQKMVKIGKAPTNQVVVDDPAASRVHAVIELSPAGASIIDMGSTAGTLLNGARVNKAQIQNGSEITIGSTLLLVTFVDAATQPAVPPEGASVPGLSAAAGAAQPAMPPEGASVPGLSAATGSAQPAMPPEGASVPGLSAAAGSAQPAPAARPRQSPRAPEPADLSTDEVLSGDDPIMKRMQRARRQKLITLAVVLLVLLGAGAAIVYSVGSGEVRDDVKEADRYSDFGKGAERKKPVVPATFDSSERRNPDLYIYQRVDPGVTLESLATRFYGGADKVQYLVDANPGAAGPTAAIAPGTAVRIPRWVVVEAKEGETIAGIAAAKLGTVEAAQKLFEFNVNVIDKPEDLAAGMQIRVPLLVVEK